MGHTSIKILGHKGASCTDFALPASASMLWAGFEVLCFGLP